jgi:cell division septum initiation protein DivIVA
MRAFARYGGILRENEELRKEIKALDDKLNEALQFLLERIDELHQNKNETKKPVGFKYKKH